MARTTVDDCLEQCPNHFDLTYRASRRARDLMKRGDPRVPEYGDKPVVVALRELADPKTLEEPAPPEAERPKPSSLTRTPDAPLPARTSPTPPDRPDSPDSPAPADPTGEREAAGVARTPDEPQPPDNID